jgi:hypothetical protein
MRCLRVFCLATVLTAFSSFAIPAQTPKSSSESAVFLGRVAGVYKEQFQNAFVNGEKYPSEDVLEVVPVDSDAAYVRMDLEFSNGHSGRIYGIATYARTRWSMRMARPATSTALSSMFGPVTLLSRDGYEKLRLQFLSRRTRKPGARNSL